MMYNRFMGYGIFNSGWSILLVIGVILTVLAIGYLILKRNKTTSGNSAQEILDQKYVSGEITEEEYNKRKSVLIGK